MTLRKYIKLINELPVWEQAFEINLNTWKNLLKEENKALVEVISNYQKATIILNRWELVNSKSSIDKRIIEILMWGYPRGGRGYNIKYLLENKNFEKLKLFLTTCCEKEQVTEKFLLEKTDDIKGLGISTVSKCLHFLKIKIDDHPTQILDDHIIEVLKKGTFNELEILKGISRRTALKNYLTYISRLDEIAKQNHVQPDQIELFLFMFGKQLKSIS